MSVLVDTSVWSQALRGQKAPNAEVVEELKTLILEGRVIMIGPIRQEILSGIRFREQFTKLSSRLASFPDEELVSSDFIDAAQACNRCLDSGVITGSIDILISVVSLRLGVKIFTTDKDFDHISSTIPIKLHS